MAITRSRLIRAGLALPISATLLFTAACAEEGGEDAGVLESDFQDLETQVGDLDERVSNLENEVGLEGE